LSYIIVYYLLNISIDGRSFRILCRNGMHVILVCDWLCAKSCRSACCPIGECNWWVMYAHSLYTFGLVLENSPVSLFPKGPCMSHACYLAVLYCMLFSRNSKSSLASLAVVWVWPPLLVHAAFREALVRSGKLWRDGVMRWFTWCPYLIRTIL
jgi:hypothetical protein